MWVSATAFEPRRSTPRKTARMRCGPAGSEAAERRPIPAASGRLAFAAVFGDVGKRLAETHMPPIHAVAQADLKVRLYVPHWPSGGGPYDG
jgi:hypothetical protein